MKIRVLRTALILALVALAAFFLSPSTGAQDTQQVIPLANVDPTGSLTIIGGATENLIDFGNIGPGTTQQNSLSLGVTANASWRLTVTTSQDFECTNLGDAGYGDSIPSTDFVFTSSGPAGPTYNSSDTPFRTATSGSQTTDVVTDGSPVQDCQVDVAYKLLTPDVQPAGYYSAGPHVYTLIVQ